MTEPRKHGGVSRRLFLQGSGAAAAATGLLAQDPAQGQDASTNGVVRGATVVTFQVNGKQRKITVEPRTTLLDALRYQLDLTGAKPVSSDGSSGASTVLVDGKPVMASTTLAIACNGKSVTTCEGLQQDGRPDPVCTAFVAHDASQCGFCTPGFVVAVRAFLNKHPDATEQQIREGLNGNICRCGTYANVIEAALAVVKGGADA